MVAAAVAMAPLAPLARPRCIASRDVHCSYRGFALRTWRCRFFNPSPNLPLSRTHSDSIPSLRCRYTAGEPSNLPDLYFGPNGINLGGLLAWEFCLMHWVEVRRWQDYKKPGSVNEVRDSPGQGAEVCRAAAL